MAKYHGKAPKSIGKNKHSAIQICRWAKSKIKGQRNCYKQVFGIDSARCIQMTPTLDFCPFSCVFCWRNFGENRGQKKEIEWDKPKEIVDSAIEEQRKILSGFGGSKYVSQERLKRAMQPNHFAISLDGEPSVYPYIADLIKEIKARGFSVFLVTNGVMPLRIKELLEKNAIPDNLSISIYATNEKDYQFITNSSIKNNLEKIKESLALLRKFENCRTNIRLTLIKDLNMEDYLGYTGLIEIGKPKFVTLKGYSYIGASQKRLKARNMPSMEEIEEFAEKIKKELNYVLMHKDSVSRVVILARDEDVLKWNEKKIEEQRARQEKLEE